jgi:hypothetical protein
VLGASVLVVVGLVIGATPAPARADSLERQLLRHALQILKSLQDRGVKNVGVLIGHAATHAHWPGHKLRS